MMMRLFCRRLSIGIMDLGILALLTPTAFACSFGTLRPKMMSELADESRYVIRAEVLYIDKSDIADKTVNRLARFKPIKFLKHAIDNPNHIDAYYNFDASFCGAAMHFERGRIYTVFLKPNETGFLRIEQSSNNNSSLKYIYDETQVRDYFDNAKDSFLASEMCLLQVKEAYAEAAFLGNAFKVRDKNCVGAKAYYDKHFR